MSEQIRVIVVKPGRYAHIEDIDSGLASYQNVVGGYIDQYTPYDDDIAFVIREEDRDLRRNPNRAIIQEGRICDILCGTFFICGLGEEEYASLTDEQCEKYLKMFYFPERFENTYNGVLRFITNKEMC